MIASTANTMGTSFDSAAFHVGQSLRRDRIIRARLRGAQPPWRVEELRAADLHLGRALVERLVRD